MLFPIHSLDHSFIISINSTNPYIKLIVYRNHFSAMSFYLLTFLSDICLHVLSNHHLAKIKFQTIVHGCCHFKEEHG